MIMMMMIMMMMMMMMMMPDFSVNHPVFGFIFGFDHGTATRHLAFRAKDKTFPETAELSCKMTRNFNISGSWICISWIWSFLGAWNSKWVLTACKCFKNLVYTPPHSNLTTSRITSPTQQQLPKAVLENHRYGPCRRRRTVIAVLPGGTYDPSATNPPIKRLGFAK